MLKSMVVVGSSALVGVSSDESLLASLKTDSVLEPIRLHSDPELTTTEGLRGTLRNLKFGKSNPFMTTDSQFLSVSCLLLRDLKKRDDLSLGPFNLGGLVLSTPRELRENVSFTVKSGLVRRSDSRFFLLKRKRMTQSTVRSNMSIEMTGKPILSASEIGNMTRNILLQIQKACRRFRNEPREETKTKETVMPGSESVCSVVIEIFGCRGLWKVWQWDKESRFVVCCYWFFNSYINYIFIHCNEPTCVGRRRDGCMAGRGRQIQASHGRMIFEDARTEIMTDAVR